MKLKKCPYCGSHEVSAVLDFDECYLQIFCSDCNAEMRFCFDEFGILPHAPIEVEKLERIIATAATTWNRRSK